MRKRHLLFAFLVLMIGSLFMVQNVSAATNISFSGSAAPFGGTYQKFFAENNLNGNIIRYVKVVVTATDGNKLKVGFLHTEDWLSTATQVATTGTLAASNNTHTIYFVPNNMACPSGGTCVKVPSNYSTDGNGNDLTYDFMSGVRFTNESWFYGTLYLSGTITLY